MLCNIGKAYQLCLSLPISLKTFAFCAQFCLCRFVLEPNFNASPSLDSVELPSLVTAKSCLQFEIPVQILTYFALSLNYSLAEKSNQTFFHAW